MKTKIARIIITVVMLVSAILNTGCTSGNALDSQPDKGAASWFACKVVGIESSCDKK